MSENSQQEPEEVDSYQEVEDIFLSPVTERSGGGAKKGSVHADGEN